MLSRQEDSGLGVVVTEADSRMDASMGNALCGKKHHWLIIFCSYSLVLKALPFTHVALLALVEAVCGFILPPDTVEISVYSRHPISKREEESP